jgi:hypothetical protein
MSVEQMFALSEFADDSIEAISFAKAAKAGVSADVVREEVTKAASAGRCMLLGQSDTHIIVAWDDERPFIITITDFDKYAGDVISAPVQKGDRHG